MAWYYYKVPNDNGYQLEGHPQKMAVLEQYEITETEYNAELAAMQEHAAAVEQYTEQVKAGEIELSAVPEDCRAGVEAKLNEPEPEEPNNDYGIPNDLYNAVIDDYTLSLMDSGLL